MWRGSGRAARIAALLAGIAVLLLVLAQVFLPRIAASRIRSRIERFGSVSSVHVSAWPAIKLLWGDVDSVNVSAGRLALSPAQAAAKLWEGRGVSRMDFRAAEVILGRLRLTGATLTKRGDALSAQAHASGAAAQAALPAGLSVSLLRSGGGKVEVSASGSLFGVEAAVEAVAEASEGKLLAHPLGVLLAGFGLTLFADPHVYVEGIGAAGGPVAGYALTMRARLR